MALLWLALLFDKPLASSLGSRPDALMPARKGLRSLLLFCMATMGMAAMSMESAHALDLSEAHALAVSNDPTLRAATHEREAAQAYRDMGRASMLPQLSYSYSRGRNDSTVRQENALGEVRTERNYDNYSSMLTLEQPLFDAAAWARYRLGSTQADEGLARYRAQFLDLAQRLFKAYTAALLARDQQGLTDQQVRAMQALLQQNQRLRELGEGTATDVLETQASLADAQATKIESDDALALALRNLENLIGKLVSVAELPTLNASSHASLPLLWPDLAAWQQQAITGNPQLSVKRLSVEAAGHELSRQKAGHLPRVSLYATHRRTDSDSENTYGQNYRTSSIGVRVVVPLFSGGSVSAQARQAAATQAQNMDELDALQLQVQQDINRAWRRVQSAPAVILAREQAVLHAREQLQATRKSVLGGERVNIDVLAAERQLHDAGNALAEARYTYLQSWLDLHLGSGQFDTAQLQQIDGQWATHPLPTQTHPSNP